MLKRHHHPDSEKSETEPEEDEFFDTSTDFIKSKKERKEVIKPKSGRPSTSLKGWDSYDA